MTRIFLLLILAVLISACSGPAPVAAQNDNDGEDDVLSHPRQDEEADLGETTQITSQEFLMAGTQYTNSDYGFSLTLSADLYVQEGINPAFTPAPLLEVDFFEQSPDVQSQIPQLTVRVFPYLQGQDLQLWLNEQGAAKRFGSKLDVTPYEAGDLTGLRVTSMRMMAPRSAVYLVSGEYVFELTPLGQAGEEMLGSFSLQK